MSDKVVVLYSSGLDSLVNLYILKYVWKLEPILLFVNYNQKASTLEYQMTEKVSKKLSLPLVYKEVNLDVESKLITGTTDANIEVSDSREAPVEIVPYRNISLAHIGILTARKHGAKYVSFGFNVSEAGAYPDNTPRFLIAAGYFESLGNNKKACSYTYDLLALLYDEYNSSETDPQYQSALNTLISEQERVYKQYRCR